MRDDPLLRRIIEGRSDLTSTSTLCGISCFGWGSPSEFAGSSPFQNVRSPGPDQFSTGREPGEAVPGTTGTPCHCEAQTGRGKLMYKYEVILYWSHEDDAFVAEVPELPGCMAHGASQEAALKQVKEAINLWLDTAREFGDPIPEPKGERLMLA